MTRLLLAGDIAPVDLHRFELDAPACEELGSADVVLANLETPVLANPATPMAKAGPTLRGTFAPVELLRRSCRKLVLSLANNHIMDYGVAGLSATLDALRPIEIDTLGAGETDAAAACHSVVAGPLRLGVLAACDPQFGVAGRGIAGVAAVGPWVFSAIRRARLEHDRVVVSIHGGAEMSRWPSPAWMQLLVALGEAGADLVHAHHPHLSQGIARAGNSWIVFSPGNLIVNPALWKARITRTSLTFSFDLENLQAAPRISRYCCTERAGQARLECLERDVEADDPEMKALNEPLVSPPLLTALWHEYAMEEWKHFYAAALAPLGSRHGLRRTLRTSLATIADLLRGRGRGNLSSSRLLLLHFVRCSQHAEAISTALSLLEGLEPDGRTPESACFYRHHCADPLSESGT